MIALLMTLAASAGTTAPVPLVPHMTVSYHQKASPAPATGCGANLKFAFGQALGNAGFRKETADVSRTPAGGGGVGQTEIWVTARFDGAMQIATWLVTYSEQRVEDARICKLSARLLTLESDADRTVGLSLTPPDAKTRVHASRPFYCRSDQKAVQKWCEEHRPTKADPVPATR